MKQSYLFSKLFLLVLVISFITSCRGQSNSNKENDNAINKLPKKVDSQIGEYVGVFQDSKGNFWFPRKPKNLIPSALKLELTDEL